MINEFIHNYRTDTFDALHSYIYIYVCVYVCVFCSDCYIEIVFVREALMINNADLAFYVPVEIVYGVVDL